MILFCSRQSHCQFPPLRWWLGHSQISQTLCSENRTMVLLPAMTTLCRLWVKQITGTLCQLPKWPTERRLAIIILLPPNTLLPSNTLLPLNNYFKTGNVQVKRPTGSPCCIKIRFRKIPNFDPRSGTWRLSLPSNTFKAICMFLKCNFTISDIIFVGFLVVKVPPHSPTPLSMAAAPQCRPLVRRHLPLVRWHLNSTALGDHLNIL